METLQKRIADLGITSKACWASENPNMPDCDNMDHWRVTLFRSHRKMTVYFSMGYGHNGKEPTTADVLNAVASDSSGVANAGSFENWSAEYGYDVDSRKAHRTFTLCQRSYERLRKFIADESEFQALLYDTESL